MTVGLNYSFPMVDQWGFVLTDVPQLYVSADIIPSLTVSYAETPSLSVRAVEVPTLTVSR
jgi:hypothetical protein